MIVKVIVSKKKNVIRGKGAEKCEKYAMSYLKNTLQQNLF
jgi:hypothetical protein